MGLFDSIKSIPEDFVNQFRSPMSRAQSDPAYRNAFLSIYNPAAYQAEAASAAAQAESATYQRIFDQGKSMGLDMNTSAGRNAFLQLAMTSGNAGALEHGKAEDKAWQANVYSREAPTDDMKEAQLAWTDPNLYSQILQAKLARASAAASRITVNNEAAAYPVPAIGLDISKEFANPIDGSYPSPTMDHNQFNKELADGKWTRVDTASRERLQNISAAEGMVDSGANLYAAISKDLPTDGVGIKAAAQNYIYGSKNRITSEDGGKIKAYNDSMSAQMPLIARALGEKGALSDGDVRRIEALAAQIGNFNPLMGDSVESAALKIKIIKNILSVAKGAYGGVPQNASVTYEPIPDKTGKFVLRRVIRQAGKPPVFDDSVDFGG